MYDCAFTLCCLDVPSAQTCQLLRLYDMVCKVCVYKDWSRHMPAEDNNTLAGKQGSSSQEPKAMSAHL